MFCQRKKSGKIKFCQRKNLAISVYFRYTDKYVKYGQINEKTEGNFAVYT